MIRISRAARSTHFHRSCRSLSHHCRLRKASLTISPRPFCQLGYVPGMMLNEAAESGNALVVEELLKRDVSPFDGDCNANTPLLYAAVGCQ